MKLEDVLMNYKLFQTLLNGLIAVDRSLKNIEKANDQVFKEVLKSISKFLSTLILIHFNIVVLDGARQLIDTMYYRYVTSILYICKVLNNIPYGQITIKKGGKEFFCFRKEDSILEAKVKFIKYISSILNQFLIGVQQINLNSHFQQIYWKFLQDFYEYVYVKKVLFASLIP